MTLEMQCNDCLQNILKNKSAKRKSIEKDLIIYITHRRNFHFYYM